MSHFLFFTPSYVTLLTNRFALSEKISKTIIARNIVRSLPDRFGPKVIAIEEAKDLNFMKVEDLLGSLRAFEMTFKQRKKEKSITLKSVQENSEEVAPNEENNDDELALLTKNFKKFFQN